MIAGDRPQVGAAGKAAPAANVASEELSDLETQGGASGTSASAAADPSVEAATTTPPSGRVLDVLLVVGICLVTAFIAILVVFFLPLYIGAVPFPVSILAAAAAVILLPPRCYALTGSLAAAAAPVIVWFVVTAALALSRSSLAPELTMVIGDWRLILLMIVGCLGGAASISRLWSMQLRASIGNANRPR